MMPIKIEVEGGVIGPLNPIGCYSQLAVISSWNKPQKQKERPDWMCLVRLSMLSPA